MSKSSEPMASLQNKMPEKPDKIKHWVCVATSERAMKKQAEQWVSLQRILREKDYELIKPNELHQVNKDDILYIYCHSGYEADASSQFYNKSLPYMISEIDKLSSNDVIYTPNSFLSFLQKGGLNNEHVAVKIASCNSDIFSELVAKEAQLQCIFPHMCVSGYKGQLVLCQGALGAKLAGLEEPFVTRDKKGHWSINEEEFSKGEKRKMEFQAKLHRRDSIVTPYEDVQEKRKLSNPDEVHEQIKKQKEDVDIDGSGSSSETLNTKKESPHRARDTRLIHSPWESIVSSPHANTQKSEDDIDKGMDKPSDVTPTSRTPR